LSNTVAAERQPANQHTPIFLAHGTLDPVVALTRAQATHQQLEDLRYDVRWKTYSMPHAVCPDEVADIAAFLTSVLK
ncbi:MAG: carboxylesterase, partial [Candidimonas sp.]